MKRFVSRDNFHEFEAFHDMSDKSFLNKIFTSLEFSPTSFVLISVFKT